MIIRSAETSDELDAFFMLATQTFNPDSFSQTVAFRWRQRVEGMPGYVPGQVRCAFVGTTPIGGYILYERMMRIGSVAVPTGCFAGLVTHPEWYGRGVATALMHDAARRANERQMGLILLDGIAGFYRRFGYVDVFDTTRHAVSRASLAAWSRSPYHVRPATLNDAPVLMELYERHYAGYSGSFVRSLAWQRHDLAWRLADHPPLIACDETGRVRGYLLVPLYAPRHHAVEAAADDWNAALALLQYHASAVAEATDIDWSLPSDSPMFYALADRLNLTSRTYRHPDEGWMALPAHLPTLFAAIAPLLEERRRAVRGEAFWLRIGDAAPVLAVGQGSGTPERPTAVLTPQGFMQLLFGFRPAHWIACQPGVFIPSALLPTLDAIFPTGHAWIAGSDAF
ncbi:MAG: GNAT family N-acetyltransferase [Roseiflexus sp.]